MVLVVVVGPISAQTQVDELPGRSRDSRLV